MQQSPSPAKAGVPAKALTKADYIVLAIFMLILLCITSLFILSLFFQQFRDNLTNVEGVFTLIGVPFMPYVLSAIDKLGQAKFKRWHFPLSRFRKFGLAAQLLVPLGTACFIAYKHVDLLQRYSVPDDVFVAICIFATDVLAVIVPLLNWVFQHSPWPAFLRRSNRFTRALRGNVIVLFACAVLSFAGLPWYAWQNQHVAQLCATAGPTAGAGIGAVLLGRECIGLSDGSIAFDMGGADGNLKLDAAAQLRDGDRAKEESLLEEAIIAEPSDAEARIYLEDARVMTANRPHVTLVIDAVLSGKYMNAGRYTLQGAYIEQMEHNNQCYRQPARQSPACLVNLLIANDGSQLNEVQFAQIIAGRILEVAKDDPTIIGIVSGLNSEATINLSNTVNAHYALPVVAATASSSFLDNQANFHRVVPTNARQAELAAQYVTSLGKQRVVILYRSEDAYATDLRRAFTYYFPSGNIIGALAYPVDNQAQIQQAAQQAFALRPDAIYCACYAVELSVVLEELPTSGPLASLQIIGGDAAYQLGDYSALGKSRLASHVSFVGFGYPGAWHDLAPSVPVPTFFADYAGFYYKGQPNVNRYLTTGTMTAFDATASFMKALLLVDGPPAPTSVEQAFGRINGRNALQGVTGQLTFGNIDANPQNKALFLLAFRADGSVYAKRWVGKFLIA